MPKIVDSDGDRLDDRLVSIEKDAEEAVNYALNAAWPDASEVNMHVFASN